MRSRLGRSRGAAKGETGTALKGRTPALKGRTQTQGAPVDSWWPPSEAVSGSRTLLHCVGGVAMLPLVLVQPLSVDAISGWPCLAWYCCSRRPGSSPCPSRWHPWPKGAGGFPSTCARWLGGGHAGRTGGEEGDGRLLRAIQVVRTVQCVWIVFRVL